MCVLPLVPDDDPSLTTTALPPYHYMRLAGSHRVDRDCRPVSVALCVQVVGVHPLWPLARFLQFAGLCDSDYSL